MTSIAKAAAGAAGAAAARPYDVIVWGGTGFTGRLIARYLTALPADRQVRWAVAGRDAAKVRAAIGDPTESLSVLQAELSSPESMDAMCRQASVIIACVGPFTLYGKPLVEACLRCGTHYVDITGEANYVRDLVETVHDRAATAGLFIVPCSGFDSVPSELINWVLHRQAEAQGEKLRHVGGFMKAGGGPSRGTLDSVVVVFEHAREIASPLVLIPKASRQGIPASPVKKGVWYDSGLRSWTGMFFMAAINERVVKRTNFLMGRAATYTEAARGTFTVCLVNTLMMFAAALFMIPFVRRNAQRFFPAPRDGPSQATMDKSNISMVGVGEFQNPKKAPIRVELAVKGMDGYKSTAVFASETAMALARGEMNAEAKPGVVTPAYAVGDGLVRRLRTAGFTIGDFRPRL